MRWRELTPHERQYLVRLLSEDFPGRAAIQEQLQTALVRQIDANGSLEFDVRGNPEVQSHIRIPVEGEFEDVDGVTIHMLLHVLNGHVKELEVYKEDSSTLVCLPQPENLRIFKSE